MSEYKHPIIKFVGQVLILYRASWTSASTAIQENLCAKGHFQQLKTLGHALRASYSCATSLYGKSIWGHIWSVLIFSTTALFPALPNHRLSPDFPSLSAPQARTTPRPGRPSIHSMYAQHVQTSQRLHHGRRLRRHEELLLAGHHRPLFNDREVHGKAPRDERPIPRWQKS